MPKAKPVSLHPLSFDEALQALMRVDPERVGDKSQPDKPARKRKSKPKDSRKK